MACGRAMVAKYARHVRDGVVHATVGARRRIRVAHREGGGGEARDGRRFLLGMRPVRRVGEDRDGEGVPRPRAVEPAQERREVRPTPRRAGVVQALLMIPMAALVGLRWLTVLAFLTKVTGLLEPSWWWIAAGAILFCALGTWASDAFVSGGGVPWPMIAPTVLGILLFPATVRLCAGLDRWRLTR